jgi:very-short-patch-repair endonuclease
MHYGASPAIFVYARKLRQNPTRAERVLWRYLRKHYLGYKFRRQHPAWKYVLDFYCHPLRLAIEIDGGIHEEKVNEMLDKERETNLNGLGITIIRFTNEMVCFDVDEVISTICWKINEVKQLRYKL